MSKDTAHATQNSSGHTGEQELSGPGERTNKTPSGHSGEQESSGQGHRTRNTTHGACTLVNRSLVAKDTAHATQHIERVHR